MEINITWNICRVCLQEENKNAKESNNQFRNLFNEDNKLAQHIYDFSGIMMKPNDSLPDKICLKCIKIVNNAVQFRKTCRASNSYLQNVLERTKSASSLFKPAINTSVASDDEDGLEEQMETEAVGGNDHFQVEKAIESECDKKIVDYSKAAHKQSALQEKIAEMVESREQNVADEVVNDTGVNLVEVMEHSDDIINEIIDDNPDKTLTNAKLLKKETKEISKITKSETSQLQKFYMNAKFTKIKNTEEDFEECNEQDLIQADLAAEQETTKEDQKEDDLYYLLKDIKNELANCNDNQEVIQETEEQSPQTDESIEYYAIEDEEDIEENIEQEVDEEDDDDLMLHFETNNEDNPNQVTSTVDTNDESEYNEQNSNTSNMISDLEEEYIVDDSVSNYNIISDAEEEIKIKSLDVSTTAGNTGCITMSSSRRKPNRYLAKVSDSSSTTARVQQQVCVCEICGNQFTNRNLMNLHMKVHYQEKNHQCELCFKRFITACNLQAHMRIHTGEKPFQCRYCGRRFNDRSSSLRHERTHTNEKPFKCSSCGKTFTLATTLQNHMKVHTNERSYRCEPCGKSFKLSHHLKTHQNTSLHRSVVNLVRLEN
ncbi:zinc finger and BTB domain-containing protein 14-like [Lucilia cuprina]|uniref:zinc finger and BTB domain-containing protein 14-like n=1 Tax=Lucilia cuprina TaxID=7375 RepID=UPI001F05E17A|nr:zinc finger and BTB domain-containing protein 14-like [Lucilia cuprina]